MDLQQAKHSRRKITMVACYDYAFASIVDSVDIDIILVGDSGAMTTIASASPASPGSGQKFVVQKAGIAGVHHLRARLAGAGAPDGRVRAGAGRGGRGQGDGPGGHAVARVPAPGVTRRGHAHGSPGWQPA
ncbi:MAG: 3-methyl-2-oxobutanoate hydroxymethyltransferase [Bacillota bacterium]|nr:3-methyl-2-oxobutanoate hydroxymethyltransferase [Bacillota bacterium]